MIITKIIFGLNILEDIFVCLNNILDGGLSSSPRASLDRTRQRNTSSAPRTGYGATLDVTDAKRVCATRRRHSVYRLAFGRRRCRRRLIVPSDSDNGGAGWHRPTRCSRLPHSQGVLGVRVNM